jgi:hypothetical protein
MISLPITRYLRFGVGSGFLLSSFVCAQTLRFDSQWWRHGAHDGERTGFVHGYLDCPKAAKQVSGASSNDYVAYVYEHLGYSKHSSVPSVLAQAHLYIKTRPILRGGEEYPEHHGWLDGAWWGTASTGDPDEKRGYVEGYLQCGYGEVTASRTYRYVDALNQHFAKPSNEHHKIANVLQPIIDGEKKRS